MPAHPFSNYFSTFYCIYLLFSFGPDTHVTRHGRHDRIYKDKWSRKEFLDHCRQNARWSTLRSRKTHWENKQTSVTTTTTTTKVTRTKIKKYINELRMYLIAHCIYIYTQTHWRKEAYGMRKDRCPLTHIYPDMKIT